MTDAEIDAAFQQAGEAGDKELIRRYDWDLVHGMGRPRIPNPRIPPQKWIRFTGTNATEVWTFLGRECWVRCSGDLAVMLDNQHVGNVPIGWWVANDGGGIQTNQEEF